MRSITSLAFVVFLIVAGAGANATETARLPGDAARGQKLHAAQCVACHDDTVYTRPNRQVKGLGGLIQRVEICYRQLQVELSHDQLNDLVAYLNETYYRFE